MRCQLRYHRPVRKIDSSMLGSPGGHAGGALLGDTFSGIATDGGVRSAKNANPLHPLSLALVERPMFSHGTCPGSATHVLENFHMAHIIFNEHAWEHFGRAARLHGQWLVGAHQVNWGQI